jgi:hypothetical protein
MRCFLAQDIPSGVAAALSALHLRSPATERLRALDDRDWRGVLDFCDRSQLTLALRRATRDQMPTWVRERTDSDAAHNALRTARLLELYSVTAARFQAAGIPFLLLKGFSQGTWTGVAPVDRVQYDLDLLATSEQVLDARDLLIQDGYELMPGFESFPTDHLPALIRKTGWEWRGDYFDVDIPTSIELHFRLWDRATELLDAPGTEHFWERRRQTAIAGIDIPVLAGADAVGYAALHVLRHLLRGSLRAWHVYELALMLERQALNHHLWREWSEWHAPQLRSLECVAFCIAQAWFGCLQHETPAREVAAVPARVGAWVECCASSPVSALYAPNKDEIWLHFALLGRTGDRVRIARRRLAPLRLPGAIDGVYLPAERMTVMRRFRARLRYARFLASRALYHLAALPRVLASGVRFARAFRAVEPARNRRRRSPECCAGKLPE